MTGLAERNGGTAAHIIACMMQEQQGAASAAVNETAQTMPSPDNPAAHATVEHGVSSQDTASVPPVARREPVARTHHGDTFLDPYAG